MIELIHGDCQEYMAGLEDDAFDLAIVDPPYGINENGSTNHSRSKCAPAKNYKSFAGGDKEPPPVEYFTQLKRVSKNQIIWGGNHLAKNISCNSPCWIVWDKENGSNDFADCEIAYTSFKSAVRLFRYRWAGMLQGNMKQKEIRVHPAQKPVALYKWLLNNYAKPGDRILDTHSGSASSAIACHDHGFDMVGIELDEDYYLAAKNRYEKHARQQRLF